MAGISVSGLISGSFDWKSVVDQLIQIDSAPIARLQTEESTNIDRLAALAMLKTKLTDLQTSTTALSSSSLFSGRTANVSASGTGWSASASADTVAGSYRVDVTQLATTAQLNGTAGITSSLSATDDVSGVTIATMATAKAVTAGNFSINGHQVAVALTDSLKDVFDKISAATGGIVTASYATGTDKITLTSSDNSEIILGASNDTSNFLSALRLANNGTDTIASSGTLGSATLNVPLASARLRGSFGAVDVDGNGAFAINGVAIDYNVNTDSISDVLARITASGAGVTASYDSGQDRVVLANKTTGDTGIGISDTTGTFLSALGIGAGATLQRGTDAQFSINGGATLTSRSNTLDADAHGIAGLSILATTESTQTINVAADTASMKTAIQAFMTNFNAVQSYIDTQSKITKGADNKVTAALLANNHEVQTWASDLRRLAFGQVTGVTGTIQRLADLGIDFSSTDSTLSIKDSGKLDAALANHGSDVSNFFSTSTTGLASKFADFLTSKLDTTNGSMALQMATLNKQNTGIDAQIATLNTRLAQQRELLTTAFLSMQNAQSRAQQQQTTLTNMFDSKKSS